MREVKIIAGLVLACIPGVSVMAQSENCNWRGRESDIVAGVHNKAETACSPRICFTVLGQSMDTPVKCDLGWSRYTETRYKCGASEEKGRHCNSNGILVTIEQAGGGACPDPFGLLNHIGGAFTGWDKVPDTLVAALKCKPPKITITRDYGATTEKCTTGKGTSAMIHGKSYIGGLGLSFTYWEGDPVSVTSSAAPFSPFLGEYDFAQTADSASVTGVLGGVVSSHGFLAGASVSVGLKVEHFDGPGGSPSHESNCVLQGDVLFDQRFALTRTTVAADASTGEAATAITKMSFDGQRLAEYPAGAEAGNLYLKTFPRVGSIVSTAGYEVGEVFRWVSDPYEVPLFESLDLEESIDPATGHTLVRRMITRNGAAFLDCDWLIDIEGPVAHPVRFRSFDSLGQVRKEIGYEGYSMFDGSWRPSVMTKTLFTNPSSTGARTVITMRFESAEAMSSGEISDFLPEYEDSQKWMIWR